MSDRTTTVTVTQDGKVVATMDLTPAEALNFLFIPARNAIDDGEPSWRMQEDKPDRLNEIAEFANQAYDGTFQGLRT